MVAMVAGCGRVWFDMLADANGDGTGPDGAAIPACTVADCPAGYVRMGGGCYRAVTIATPWLDAELACEADGAHLFVTDDDTEHFVLHTLSSGIGRVWIGWSDRRGPDNVFRWVAPNAGGVQQNTPCYFPNGEPDAGDADHCVAQEETNTCGDNIDLDCNMPLAYVCECDGNLADPTAY